MNFGTVFEKHTDFISDYQNVLAWGFNSEELQWKHPVLACRSAPTIHGLVKRGLMIQMDWKPCIKLFIEDGHPQRS